MANLMIFCGICRKFDKFHGKQQNAMANLETGMRPAATALLVNVSAYLDDLDQTVLKVTILEPFILRVSLL